MLGLVEARRQRDVADVAKDDAVKAAADAERARVEEAAQRRNAEAANRQAVEALKSFTDDLMGKVLGNRDELTETETAILRERSKR